MPDVTYKLKLNVFLDGAACAGLPTIASMLEPYNNSDRYIAKRLLLPC